MKGSDKMTQHQHLTNQLETLRKQIEAGKMKKVQAETRITSFTEQYNKTAEELKALGIDPKKAAETIAEMEQSIAKEIAEIQKLLPSN